MKLTSQVPFVFLCASLSGCTCSKSSTTTGELSASAAATVSVAPSARVAPSASVSASSSAVSSAKVEAPDAAPWTAPAGADVFSAPIAGVKASGDHVLAAGLVVSAQAIRLVSLTLEGTTEWTADVLTGVHWKEDAKLRVFAAGDGAAVMWAGERNGKNGKFVAITGPRGKVLGEAFEVGSVPCATLDGLVWTESPRNAPVKVRMRKFTENAAKDVATLRLESAPSLSCGDHAVYAFAVDDDRTVHTIISADGKPQKPEVVVTAKEFEDEDQERGFEAYLEGDTLGMVRTKPDGQLVVRELGNGVLTPWTKLKHGLESDEWVEEADADAQRIVIVYSKEAGDDCANGGGRKMFSLTLDKKTRKETVRVLAPPVCGKEVSGVWMEELLPRSFLAAWVEPGSRVDDDGAPFRGFGYVSVVEGGAPVHVRAPADYIADAGCDKQACYVVALARTTGTDGMAPEALRVVKFP